MDKGLLLEKLQNEGADALTPEEITFLLGDGEGEGNNNNTQPPPNQTVTARLPDGTVLEAANHEELARLLEARMEAKPQPTQPQNQNQTRPSWDVETFKRKFIEDPTEGLGYLEESKHGFRTADVIKALMPVLKNMNDRLEATEAQHFIDTTEDYEPSDANKEVLNRIISQKGWAKNAETMKDAWAIAKDRGMVKVETPQEKPKERKAPPRITSDSGSQSDANADLMARANSMPLDKLEELLINAGMLTQSRH